MRAAALVMLALAAVFPRGARWATGAVAGGLVVRAVWTSGFDQGGGRAWFAVAAVVLVAVAASLLSECGPAPDGWRWVVLCGAAAGVYACVPETDQFREVMVVLVAGLLVEIGGLVVVPPAAFNAAWGLVVWAALYGATGRPSALAAGLFATLPPLAAAWAERRAGGWAAVVVGGLWAVAGVVAARVGGLGPTVGPALTAVAVAGVVAVAVSAVVVRLPLWRSLDG